MKTCKVSKFRVGDIVEWNSNREGYNAFKGDAARVVGLDPDGELVYVKWITKIDQNDGGYDVLHFDLVERKAEGVGYSLTEGKKKIEELVEGFFDTMIEEMLLEIRDAVDQSQNPIKDINLILDDVNQLQCDQATTIDRVKQAKNLFEVVKAVKDAPIDDITIISCLIDEDVRDLDF